MLEGILAIALAIFYGTAFGIMFAACLVLFLSNKRLIKMVDELLDEKEQKFTQMDEQIQEFDRVMHDIALKKTYAHRN